MSKKSKFAKLAAYRSGVDLNTTLGGILSNYKHLRSISKVFEDREGIHPPLLEVRSARETELDVRFSNLLELLNNNLIKINNRGAIAFLSISVNAKFKS